MAETVVPAGQAPHPTTAWRGADDQLPGLPTGSFRGRAQVQVSTMPLYSVSCS